MIKEITSNPAAMFVLFVFAAVLLLFLLFLLSLVIRHRKLMKKSKKIDLEIRDQIQKTWPLSDYQHLHN